MYIYIVLASKQERKARQIDGSTFFFLFLKLIQIYFTVYFVDICFCTLRRSLPFVQIDGFVLSNFCNGQISLKKGRLLLNVQKQISTKYTVKYICM
jgi:hypothetical protein